MTDETPGPDQIPGAPHPRETPNLFGQAEAETSFLQAFNAGRLHHAWLLIGPSGTGKATLAYKIARFLLATPAGESGGMFAPPAPTTLEISPDHPVCARILAGSEPGLRVITRSVNTKTDRMRDEIVVDDIRRLADFFHLSAADGGHRVVIVDAADDLNVSAANALLKMLEEPPANTTLILLAHQPSRLLPTIRSRCRTLRLATLLGDDMTRALEQAGMGTAPDAALTELSRGSVGEAIRLQNLSGLDIYAELIGLLATLPRLDQSRALKLAEAAAQRGAEAKRDVLVKLMNVALARLSRQGASGIAAPDAALNESQVFARLAPTPHAARAWADRSAEISQRLQHGLAVNVDPTALLLDSFFKLRDTAEDISASVPA